MTLLHNPYSVVEEVALRSSSSALLAAGGNAPVELLKKYSSSRT